MIKHIEVEEICIKQVVNNPIYINGFFLYYFPCQEVVGAEKEIFEDCLLYTSPSPRDRG